jgi:rubredoxin
MVRTVDTPDGDAYRCEECGKLFDEESAAERHEADCFVPPSM